MSGFTGMSAGLFVQPNLFKQTSPFEQTSAYVQTSQSVQASQFVQAGQSGSLDVEVYPIALNVCVYPNTIVTQTCFCSGNDTIRESAIC